MATCRKVRLIVVNSSGNTDFSTYVQYEVHIDHQARQVTTEDFRIFTHILASDEANLRNLQRMRPRNATAEVRLFGSYDDNRQIGDPYYGGLVSAISFPHPTRLGLRTICF